MELVTFLEDCLRHGIQLYITDGELGYRAKKGALTNDILLSIKKRKTEIINYLAQADPADLKFKVKSGSLDRRTLFNRFLWKDYSSRLMEISSANATHSVIRRKGEIFTAPLIKSIRYLLGRHKVLNSTVEMAEGNLYLVYRDRHDPAFTEISVKGDTPDQREKEAINAANTLVWKEYDLDKGPLYRVFLIRISLTDYILGAGLHHSIGDAISIGVFFREIMMIYQSIVTCTPPGLKPVRFQYMDYLASMETWRAGSAGITCLNYWKDVLKSTPFTGLAPNEHMPSDKPGSGKSAEENIKFSSYVTSELRQLASSLRKTLFGILLSAYKISLWRMTGQEEPVVVALQAGRINTDYQNVIGNFAMEVAYKTSLAGNPCFTEITERVAHTINEAQNCQPVPLDWVRMVLAEEGISFNAPGISILSGNTDTGHDASKPVPLKLTPPGVRHGCHGFPVSCAIEFIDRPGTIEGSMVYRTDIYDESIIHIFLDQFKNTISEIIKYPEKRLHDFMPPEK